MQQLTSLTQLVWLQRQEAVRPHSPGKLRAQVACGEKGVNWVVLFYFASLLGVGVERGKG